MHPSNSQILYLGTGEGGFRGEGIFKTTDGGQTWLQLPGTANSNFWTVYQIAIHPKQPARLYAATGNGIYVSNDAGATWNRSYPAANGLFTSCTSLALRSDQAKDIVFAACGSFAASGFTYSILRNQDAAGTGLWGVVQSDPKMDATAIAISPIAPATIYAVSTTTDRAGPFRFRTAGCFTVPRKVATREPGQRRWIPQTPPASAQTS